MKLFLFPTQAVLALGLSFAAPGAAFSAIVLDGTRVIYPAEKREVNVRLTNQGDTPLVVQSWIDAGTADATPEKVASPFMLVPPLARVEPTRGQTLRLMLLNPPQPTDRESVYYLNVLEVPPKSDKAAEGNTLQLTIRSRVKVFLRPEGLPGKAADAAAALRWKVVRVGKTPALQVHNPSAYHVTLSKVAIRSDAKEVSLETGMAAPGATLEFPLQQMPAAGSTVNFAVIDDYGAERTHSKDLPLT